jgi:putative transposase
VRRRLAVQHARDKGVTERHACRLVGQWRTTQRYQPTQSNDEDRLTRSILALASQYGRFGYRRITALLKQAGWKVGKDRVQRIWRREGLKVPAKHKPHRRLWLNDGSCIRLRPEHRNHVWSYDFVEARTHDGRSLRLLVMIDEFTRECLAIRVARRLNSAHVIELLGDCMLEYGVPEYVRSDNGAEMTARRVKQWLASVGTKPLFIEPGSPWENGYCESFNGKLRDECLNGEIFYSLKEAQVVIEQWRRFYNEVRPHSSLGYRAPPAKKCRWRYSVQFWPPCHCRGRGAKHAPGTVPHFDVAHGGTIESSGGKGGRRD